MAVPTEPSSQERWNLQRGRADILSSGQFSDCQLHCAKHRFALHRSILVGCRYFKGVFGSQFAESTTAIATSYEDPALLSRVLQFIYSDEYSSNDISESSQPGQGQFGSIIDQFTSRKKKTLLHASMYSIGDRFCLPQLKTQARNKFISSFFASDSSEPIAPFSIIPIIEEVYSGTPSSDRGLRDLICLGIHTNLEELEYRISKPVLDYLDKPTKLSQAVWIDLIRLSLLPGEYRCEVCGDIGMVLKKKCSCKPWREMVHARPSCIDLQETVCLMCSRTGTLVEHVESDTAWEGGRLDDAGIVW